MAMEKKINEITTSGLARGGIAINYMTNNMRAPWATPLLIKIKLNKRTTI